MLFNSVEINGAVPVIVGDTQLWTTGLVRVLFAFVQIIDVVVPGREPDCRHAEIFQIRQVRDDAFKVAAVVIARF